MQGLVQRVWRVLASLGAVTAVTLTVNWFIHVNATTVALAYLLLILGIASTWGFIEAALASVTAALAFNLFFLPPVGTLTIADPLNWIALFSFLATALIASRLSAKAERRALDAIARQKDIERLYTFSRAILLIGGTELFPKRLAVELAEVFEVKAAALYDRRTGEIFRGGPAEFDGLDEQLRDAAMNGASYSDPSGHRVITAVRLGSEPIASLGLEGAPMPDSVLQGIANLVAIGLERARAQDLAHQVEAARQSEQLRTALIDAMAHEFKTPLTSIRAATTALLSEPEQPAASRTELLKIADEEAEHLRQLIDDAVDMARLDSGHIEVHRESCDAGKLLGEVVASLRGVEGRKVDVVCESDLPPLALDRRLIALALRQLVDNALRYSPADMPVTIRARGGGGTLELEISDHGKGISPQEQRLIFDRFYRSPVVKKQIPGSGLGLSIAHSIVRAHGGDITVRSRPGETTFGVTLPAEPKGGGQ